ncbi:MAG: helix-turn-helix transcriptional regulator [Mesorhizobium sp.]|uniref:helix-turn-helix domain-containing protein n=1 Tax=Mesorhizobium sp. TaxID=1871066 RepID=UPI00121BCB20|nr:helix-turn-helix transcriptional regulator [Mesorhizobium sp.]TIV83835.1 MAG: helix-turn-helix transcriptional regulator [Mesorhizobium sp.]
MPKPIKILHLQRRPLRVYLREWLEHEGVTAEQLAGRMETSKSVVSKLMNGRQRYNQDWLERIAYALNREDVQELLRPPLAPTANELLSRMPPETRETAINVLIDLAGARKAG